jgi:protein-L-isoaspartate(D-aspartate) O-methyltransferase
MIAVARRPQRGRAALWRPALVALLIACGDPNGAALLSAPAGAAAPVAGGDTEVARRRMVERQIEARGLRDERVLAVMRKVPRHEFVPPSVRASAYEDRPLPIGHKQTISQPYIVAVMTDLADVDAKARVLEVGTGSGYQAAVLAELVAEVYTIEIVEPLAARAARTLERLGYASVHVRHGDGYRGWPAAAPFDAILVTAAAPTVPPALLEQLSVGGRLVIPVGDRYQQLEVHTRTPSGVSVERSFPVRFVPMTGELRDAPP